MGVHQCKDPSQATRGLKIAFWTLFGPKGFRIFGYTLGMGGERDLQPCPYCHERIATQARLCKHCQRVVLYQLQLTEILDERGKHEFLRAWLEIPLSGKKHLSLGSYSEARSKLDQVPTTLVWDLTAHEAQSLAAPLKSLGVEVSLQGGLPSTASVANESTQTSRSGIVSQILYGFLGVSLLGAALWVGLKPQIDKGDDQNSLALSQSTPALPPVNLGPKEITQYSVEPREHSPSNDNPTLQEPGLKRSDVETFLSSTVFIQGENTLGSGFLIDNQGHIISNSHVTKAMQSPQVTLRDGRSFPARKIREDSRYDLSLIKIDVSGLPYLKVGNANEVFAGEPVITIGNPGGLAFTITRGIVSFNGRLLQGVPYIQTDSAINKGNSGGPMINSRLEVIGINTLTSLNDRGISFALPANFICDAQGIARSLTTPPVCPTYDSPQATMDQASITRKQAAPERSNFYALELEQLKNQLTQSEAKLTEEDLALQAKEAAVIAELQKDPHNLSLKSRVEKDIQSIHAERKAVMNRRGEARIRFIDSTVALLERQMLDKDFQHLRQQIEVQIGQLRESRRQITDFIK
jgi:S1-C subfamily serine protease